MILRNDRLQVEFVKTTGQVQRIQDLSSGNSVLASNEDLYSLDDKEAGESADRTVDFSGDKTRGKFRCQNEALGLVVEKEYELNGSILAKRVTYRAKGSEKRLLRVSSRSTLEKGFFDQGFYYVPTDDGYKVRTTPFVRGDEIKEPTKWTISRGSFNFYRPKADRVFAHYRHQINHHLVYGEVEDSVRSEFIPGGAITALGLDFLNEGHELSIESHFVVLPGDARALHRHLLNLPAYQAYRERKPPAWFRCAKMYIGDGLVGIGRGLIENRDLVAADVRNFLKLLREDEHLMVFFNHWSTSGDYPYQGKLRFLTYTSANWSKPVDVNIVRENIRWLKALSPRIKVGGYVYLSPGEGTPPLEQHPEWFLFNPAGGMVLGGDGISKSGQADFTTGYSDYARDQMQHMIKDLGFDWIHMDFSTYEAVNWRTKTVQQSWAVDRCFDETARMCEENNAAFVQNVAPTLALWSHGAYFECQQPDRWEKQDWRILGVGGHAAALYRTCRPDVWMNLCYGTLFDYGLHNAASGLRGWIRGYLTWWRFAPPSVAYERVVDELLETSLADVRVRPCWWKMETAKLEAEALRKGEGIVIPLVWHDEQAAEQTISIPARDLKFAANAYLFGMDALLFPARPFDVFQAIPWETEYLKLLRFEVHPKVGETYQHALRLEPRRNYYHLLTQVPGWVYSVNGNRTALLTPANQGVELRGVAGVGAKEYPLEVCNVNAAAEILAYVPEDWKGVNVKVNGAAASSTLVDVLGKRCCLVAVERGNARLTFADAGTPSAAPTAYRNPAIQGWQMAAERLLYTNLRHRSFEEGGRSCLALGAPAQGAGQVTFYMTNPATGPEKAGGFALQVKGTGGGGRIGVAQQAGDLWTFEIRNDFKGWKEFVVYRDQMKGGKKWDKTANLTLSAEAPGGGELTVADVRLLPARPGDLPDEEAPAKKRVEIPRASQPPVIDGQPSDPCWKTCPTATGFYHLGGSQAAGISEVKLCYDAENLYVLFASLENIEGAGKKQARGTQIWNTDHIELFFRPSLDDPTWYHLLIDPAGTIQDEKYDKMGRSEWNGDYEVKTSLNWKASWLAEYKIPFKSLGRVPKPGDVWGVNFSRKDNANEWSNWATHGEWLDSAGFGEGVFADEAK